MNMDQTPDQAVKRLTDALESLSKEPGFGKADRAFYERLATRIVNGMVPYINGRDSILEERIAVLGAQVASQQQQISNVETVANSAKSAATTVTNATRSSTPASPVVSTPPRTSNTITVPAAQPAPRQNFLTRLRRRIFG